MHVRARYYFDGNRHEYIDVERGEILPHITGMLERGGWTDPRWYTEASRDRGTAVHRMTADYDLGAIEDPREVTSAYKGWLLAHVKMCAAVQPGCEMVEQAKIHPVYRYGGRPDRVGRIFGAVAVWDIKSGDPEKGHPIQTALQAILVADEVRVPAEHIVRYGWYLKENGRYKLEEHPNTRKDFAEARRLIRAYCEVAA